MRKNLPENKDHRGKQSGEIRKARFLMMINMMARILIIAECHIVLTIFKLYSGSDIYNDSWGPPSNPKSWVVLL